MSVYTFDRYLKSLDVPVVYGCLIALCRKKQQSLFGNDNTLSNCNLNDNGIRIIISVKNNMQYFYATQENESEI